MKQLALPLAVAAALTVAACAGGSATTEPTKATSAPVTTINAPDPTTTAAATTTTSTTTTALAPTTTVDPIAEIEAAIKQARLDGDAAFSAAGLDPGNQALRDELAAFESGLRLSDDLEFLDQLVNNGEAFRKNPDSPSFIEFPGSVLILDETDGAAAVLLECRVDTDVTFVLPAEPGGVEIIVDDVVYAAYNMAVYNLEDGQWKFTSQEVLRDRRGIPSCDF